MQVPELPSLSTQRATPRFRRVLLFQALPLGEINPSQSQQQDRPATASTSSCRSPRIFRLFREPTRQQPRRRARLHRAELHSPVVASPDHSPTSPTIQNLHPSHSKLPVSRSLTPSPHP